MPACLWCAGPVANFPVFFPVSREFDGREVRAGLPPPPPSLHVSFSILPSARKIDFPALNAAIPERVDQSPSTAGTRVSSAVAPKVGPIQSSLLHSGSDRR